MYSDIIAREKIMFMKENFTVIERYREIGKLYVIMCNYRYFNELTSFFSANKIALTKAITNMLIAVQT